MIVRCPECDGTTDLNDLDVNVGHVLDCDDCGEQLKVVAAGDGYVAIRTADIPQPRRPDMPTDGPGTPHKWQERKEVNHDRSSSATQDVRTEHEEHHGPAGR